jgi:hypothetical protein
MPVMPESEAEDFCIVIEWTDYTIDATFTEKEAHECAERMSKGTSLEHVKRLRVEPCTPPESEQGETS